MPLRFAEPWLGTRQQGPKKALLKEHVVAEQTGSWELHGQKEVQQMRGQRPWRKHGQFWVAGSAPMIANQRRERLRSQRI